ncbi:hypothetical protein R3P38DRAFT_3185702 [Favolaschia claudopus]|uniref:Uncharacterized protein n=1 Tax=Favolaschia claudopus TaxID=2862362 RepID=A0AAW0C493_9AGAR
MLARDNALLYQARVGLARLAWEISELGLLGTTAVELSFYMYRAFDFLLDVMSTSTVNQHYVHQKSSEALFRSIHFPDLVPRLSPALTLLEDFSTLKPHRRQTQISLQYRATTSSLSYSSSTPPPIFLRR